MSAEDLKRFRDIMESTSNDGKEIAEANLDGLIATLQQLRQAHGNLPLATNTPNGINTEMGIWLEVVEVDAYNQTEKYLVSGQDPY